MHGQPALPKDFQHLPYANPDAPKGGRMVFGEIGGFDSLNPYIVKGRAPWGVRAHTVESLLGRSWDEPFTLYGLLAESVETPPDRSWVEFTLREEARFSDGSPVTVDDVIASMELLAGDGRPGYKQSWSKVASVEKPGPRRVRFVFGEQDRELPLILGLRPILKAGQWPDGGFAETTLEPLTGSGPYLVDRFEAGRFISFRRNPDYWGRDLPLNRGLNNLDEIRYEYFRDETARFEAFRAGVTTILREDNPIRWASGYDFPDAQSGVIKRGTFAHQRPSGMYGFVFNTRREVFQDRRVREALTLAFDFEWINQTLYEGAYERIQSYFGNSTLGFSGAAEGREREILTPFAADLPDGTLDAGYQPPVSDGRGRNRANLRAAALLLDDAGWRIRDGVRVNAAGDPLTFEILLGSSELEKVAGAFVQSLTRLGIEARIRTVDGAQYQKRRTDYDFDMMPNRWWLSLSPGNEQRFYWGAEGVTIPGTRNYMGVEDPAVEAAIDALLTADDAPDFQAAARALDRVLTSGRYVIPFWVPPADRFAWRRGLHAPEKGALYGWRPEVWWAAPDP